MKKYLLALFIIIFCLSGCSKSSLNSASDQNIDYSVQSENSIDYSSTENWAYLNENEDRAADCFLICPTVSSSKDNEYNAVLDDEYKSKFLNALDMEKGIYSDSCTMYAPYYRQAVLDVYEMSAEEREQYLETAYNDVESAFDYYIKNYNEDRPIVLAGFSQGADMVLRLLENEFDNEEYQSRLVAAYVIGWTVTDDILKEYPHIKMAQSGQDTGVVISFNSEAEDVEDSLLVPKGVKALSINPLTWTTDTAPADETFNMGACFMSGETIEEEIYQFCGAYIDEERGTLKVTGINKDDYPPRLSFLGDGVYHIYDYQFFYRNLQYNVAERLDKF